MHDETRNELKKKGRLLLALPFLSKREGKEFLKVDMCLDSVSPDDYNQWMENVLM